MAKSLKVAKEDTVACFFDSTGNRLFLQKFFSLEFTFNNRPKLLNWVEFRRVWNEIYTTIATTGDITFDAF